MATLTDEETARADLPDEATTAGPDWQDRCDTLFRWRRFLVLGVLTVAAVSMLLLWMWPVEHECEATLSLPALPTSAEARAVRQGAGDPTLERAFGPAVMSVEDLDLGLPLSTYKRIEKALTDEAVLVHGLRGVFNEADSRRMTRTFPTFVGPLTTAVRNEIQRIDKKDRITGLILTFRGPSEERARERTMRFADLVREVVLTTLALDLLDEQLVRSSVNVIEFGRERANVAMANESLLTRLSDIEKLARDYPRTGGRELVTVEGGGERYLPPAIQVVGLRVQVAENDDRIRRYDRAIAVDVLRGAFVRSMAARGRVEFAKRGAHLLSDPAAVLREEITKFVDSSRAAPAEEAVLRSDVLALADLLGACADGMRYLQLPTVRRRPSGVMPLAIGAALLVLVVLTPFAVEATQRPSRARDA